MLCLLKSNQQNTCFDVLKTLFDRGTPLDFMKAY